MRRIGKINPTALAVAALIGGWNVSSTADALTIRLSGYVPSRCSGVLHLGAPEGAVRQGFISTHCNSRYAMQITYPADLGAVQIEYAGQIVSGEDGLAVLANSAPPTNSVRAVRVRFTDIEADVTPTFLALTISPQGL